MLVADAPCAAAGTFTTSQTASHTVLLDREHLAAAGNTRRPSSSTAATPTAPMASGHARRPADGRTDRARNSASTRTLVMVSSTGIIGRPLPMEKVEQGIAQVEVRA